MKSSAINESIFIRAVLFTVGIGFLALMIIMPVVTVFTEAFAKGWAVYKSAIIEENAIAAIKLTCLVAAIAVPFNVIFGIAASWSIAKFEFIGKRFLITLIDLPFSVSPIISGLIYVLIFGANSLLAPWLEANDIQILYALPALVLTTMFVTFPFVARELIPLMQEQGTEEEQAAILLGANGWQTFFKVTLPNIKWGLLYGVLLCNARAMGEFGAVSVVSGHIRGKTNTIPLHVEILYNEYNFAAAFAVASILTILALVTLSVKTIVELKFSGKKMSIEVKNISKKFGDFKALDNVGLQVKPGELIALLGPSGSGKTTLLRIIAGLEQADSGKVFLNGKVAHNKHVKERHVGFVFQHYALFKHMTVFDNVAFGLKVRPKKHRPSKAVIHSKVMELLKLVHLDAFHNRYPSQLSGGQRQRVALARALAVEPSVLLLDEPFGALDAKVRKELRAWMRRLHDEIHITSVFVTHDQEEAMEVADRVVVMSNGKIEQIGTPEEVYHNPANSFVYDFLGNYNEFIGWKDIDGNIHLDEHSSKNAAPQDGQEGFFKHFFSKIMPGLVPDKGASVVEKKNISGRPKGAKAVKIYARPHEMWVTKTVDEHEYIKARVIHLNPAGSLVKIELERNGGAIIQVEAPKSVIDGLKIKKGDNIFVRPKVIKVFE